MDLPSVIETHNIFTTFAERSRLATFAGFSCCWQILSVSKDNLERSPAYLEEDDHLPTYPEEDGHPPTYFKEDDHLPAYLEGDGHLLFYLGEHGQVPI